MGISSFLLTGQTALVTGGATGIGFGVAECFVAAGARVVIIGRRENKLREAVERLGSLASYEVCDVTRVEELPALIERIGPVSILVNNAGVPQP